ncbi:uncharacterized protein LOC122638615 [Telopea speciosissima]|uniref:uncharacterized protein LOC122638615 n=1 Tax=Telopea speciosissima TaxID=54955 RepID=UPI001CC40CC4|nr:uncharacterized protein LOC122638615 [Telopea speciosissima]
MANSFLPWNGCMEMSGAAGAGGFSVGDRESKFPNEQQERGHEIVKQRVRKSGKSSGSVPKKPPQRGLGVAQLERLRLQERWKKITEFDNAQRAPRNIHDHQFLHHQYQFPLPFADHQNGVSVPYSRFSTPVNFGGFTSHDSHSNSQPSLLHPSRFSNGAFSATPGTPVGARSMFPDHCQMDRLRVAAKEPRFQSGNLHLYETSKELSSTQTQNQTMHCLSDQCDICKKKHIHGGNLGSNYNVGPRKYPDTMLSIGDKRDYLGWNLRTNRSINGEQQQDIGVNVNPATFSAPGVHEQEEEASEIHPRGKAVGGSSVLEYQFFPKKVDPNSVNHSSSSSSSYCNNGSGGCSYYYTDFFNTGVAAAGEASATTDTTNSLDLSLKLSL